ncbi:MAG: hypothetical protein RL181_1115 [Bacteroidota bacterium]|jgi:hypothetical protein
MFNFFKKDPIAELSKQYEKLMQEAMQLQRKGDIKGYAAKVAEAEAIQDRIEQMHKK